MQRRGQFKGYVYERLGSWYGQYRVDSTELDKNGKFKRPKITKRIAPSSGPGKVSEKRARILFFDECLRDLHKSGPLSTWVFRQFVAEIFEPQVILRCKPTGQMHYRGMLKNHVLPALGNYKMRDVTPQTVYNLIKAKIEWRGPKKERLSTQTITHIRNTVSSVFRHAKRMQAYSGDLPTEGVRLPPLEHKERSALTWNQVQAVASIIGYPDPAERGTRGPNPDPEKCAKDNLQLGALVRVLALTGLRIGEAMGLRWKHVDLDAGILKVRENFVRGKYGTLKTARSRRDIPLHSIAIAELRKLEPAGGEMPVFAGRESGKPLDQHNVASRFLRPAGRRAKVTVSWHVLRHTAATLGDQVGLSVSERQRMLGHASGAMSLHYTHSDLDVVRERMEKIGKVN